MDISILDLKQVSAFDAVVFTILALKVVFLALFTITRRNPVTAVMSLVFTFIGLAGIYATLSAHFLAILQIMVYAGAIMVLFVFVVMILNREEISPVSWRGIVTRTIGVLAGLWLVWRIADMAWHVRQMPLLKGPDGVASADFGTVAGVGMELFRTFAFPFEAISLLLLVSIVGGVIVSRSQKQEQESEENARRQAEIRAAIRPASFVGGAPSGADHGHDDHHHSSAAAHH